VALAGGVHGVQLVPHDITELLLAQALPHWWNPWLQVKPQLPAAHCATPLVGAPQSPSLQQRVISMQVDPHRLYPARQTKSQPEGVQTGSAFCADVEQATQAAPQA
jgi:hypothetical protein